MILSTTHRLIRILSAIGAGAFVLLLIVAWRLSSGPIEVHFLTPYVEEALRPERGEYEIDIGATELRWAGWNRALDLSVSDVRGIDSDGEVVASISNLAIEISGPALLRGMLAPRRILISNPTVRLVRREGEGYALDFGFSGKGEEDGEFANLTDRLMDELLGKPDPTRPLGHLTELVISDAKLELADEVLDLSLDVPDSDILLQRSPDGLDIQVGTAIDLQGEKASIDIVGGFRQEERVIDLVIGITDARLGGIGAIWETAEGVVDTDLGASGTITMSVGLDGRFRSVGFDLETGEGTLGLPAPVDHVFPIDRGVFRGRLSEAFDVLVVDELSIRSGDAGAAVGLRVSGLRSGNPVFAGNVAGRNLPHSRFAELWPESIGPLVRTWVLDNLSDGMVTDATMAIAGKLEDGELALTESRGRLDLTGFRVGYLSGMPKVNRVDGHADFDADTFDITIYRGALGELKVTEGKVVFTNLQATYPDTDINVKIAGPLPDVLELLESKPLGYASELGLDPGQAKGTAAIDLGFKFPAKVKLQLSEVAINASADLTGVALPGLVGDLGIRNADLVLDLTEKQMRVEGVALLGDAPVSVVTERYFTSPAPFRWQYQVQAMVDAGNRRTLGLDFPPFTAPFLEGPVDADVLYTQLDGGRATLVANLDLREAVMTLPGFGWAKGAGVAGRASASLVFVNDKLGAIQSFEFEGAGMEAAGKVAFNEAGDALNSIEFSKVRVGETDVEARVQVSSDGGFDIAITGPSFDAAPLIGGDEDTGETRTAVATAPDDPQAAPLPPIRISAEIDRVWLAPDRHFRDVRGFASRVGGNWETAELEGHVEGDAVTRITLKPMENFRRLDIVSDDAGAALRTLAIYDDMSGGKLKIVANIADTDAVNVVGGAEIADFQVTNAPTFARVLSAPSLAGLINMAQGEGINFARMQVPFEIRDKTATLNDARAFGSEIGLSASGTIDLERDRFDLNGTIVPAYALNSLIGQIPVLGELLTGEKGGGVFAANYSLTGSVYDPVAAVNPISALAPGFLRKFFDLFQVKDGAKAPAKQQGPLPQDNK